MLCFLGRTKGELTMDRVVRVEIEYSANGRIFQRVLPPFTTNAWRQEEIEQRLQVIHPGCQIKKVETLWPKKANNHPEINLGNVQATIRQCLLTIANQRKKVREDLEPLAYNPRTADLAFENLCDILFEIIGNCYPGEEGARQLYQAIDEALLKGVSPKKIEILCDPDLLLLIKSFAPPFR